LDEHEIAWAAGFFDGDGWAALVRQKRRRRGQPHAQINQSDSDGVPEALRRFRDAVGVGSIRGPKREPGLIDSYRWGASSRGDVTRAGALLAPWLCEQKRRQFETALGALLPDRRDDGLLPWAGGFFDAEGWTSLSDHRTHVGFKMIELGVGQSGSADELPEELVRIHAVVGVGRIYGPYDQEGAVELIYRWRVGAAQDARAALHLLQPWIGPVKRRQASRAFAVIDSQPDLQRGRVEWGSHKTHCVHGHEYALARIRPYVGRGSGVQRRDSKQCLACTREQARARRLAAKMKIGDLAAADRDRDEDGATC
jgi:hypothetical protein